MEVETLGDDRQLCHIFLVATGMAADEVWDDLLVEALFLVDLVEDALELVELFERWLTHQLQHLVASMLWGNLQATAHVLGNQLTCVLASRLVALLVLAFVQEKVVSHTTSDEALLDARKCIHGMVDFEQLAVVGVEVRTDLWVHAGRTLAVLACLLVLAAHAIHVGRRTAQVA